MALLTEVILRLRACCPAFQRRVGGTASFSAQTQQGAQFDVPYCFVVPTDSAVEKATGNQIAQKVTEGFLTIVCVDNSIQRQSGTINAYDQVEALRRSIRDALVGWEPVLWAGGKPKLVGFTPGMEDLIPNSRLDTFRMVSGTHLSMNTQKLWHAFEWSTSFQDGPALEESLRGFSDATLSGVQSIALTKGMSITEVCSPSGAIYATTDYTYDPVTGLLTRTADSQIPDGSAVIVWYEKPVPVITKLLAAYFPEVLAKVGNDPSKITPEMYDLVSEIPVGSIIREQPTVNGQRGAPETLMGHTYTVETP